MSRELHALNERIRINVGCGKTPIPGWDNFDNSIGVKIARFPWIVGIMRRIGVINKDQFEFINVARREGVLWANAACRIPVPDRSVNVLYTSHMVEHLDREEVACFLSEAYRVLRSDGILRVGVPDLKKLANDYLESGDADGFVETMLLTVPKPKTLVKKLRYIIVGPRNHFWMYDGPSLARHIVTAGFRSARIVAAGVTSIEDLGKLDLFERATESVYVEAVK